MNRFILVRTSVIQSDFDFSRLVSKAKFSSNANYSASLGTPKDPEKKRKVRCTVQFDMGGKTEPVSISVKTLSEFDIVELDCVETLISDAERSCLKIALDEISKKVSTLIYEHIGQKVNIPIPSPDDE